MCVPPVPLILLSICILYLVYRLILKALSHPTHHVYSAITPFPNFDIDHTPPLPYRPFRSGPTYFVTMGIRPMSSDEWIELDCRFKQYHLLRTARLNSRHDLIMSAKPTKVVPSAIPAAKELLIELCEYLVRRYPAVYRVTRSKTLSFFGSQNGDIQTIEIVPLNVTYDLRSQDPMTIAGLLTQDDLAVMIQGTDGKYYCQAGAILLAGSWRLKDKLGLSLDEIHLEGHVPQYCEKLQASMTRFFSKLKVDKPVVRHNYTFQVVQPAESVLKGDLDPQELAWSITCLGDEDLLHASEKDPLSMPAISGANILLRVERQSLRRLPQTGAIIFTIRTYLEPVERICREPGVASRLACAVRSMGSDILRYKGGDLWKEPLLSYLDEHC